MASKDNLGVMLCQGHNRIGQVCNISDLCVCVLFFFDQFHITRDCGYIISPLRSLCFSLNISVLWESIASNPPPPSFVVPQQKHLFLLIL